MNALNKNKTIDFTEGNILKKIDIFILPLLVHYFSQALYVSLATMIVGKFSSAGSVAIGATSAAYPMLSFLMNIFVGISEGTGICVALKIGARDAKAIEKYIHSSAIFSFIGGDLTIHSGLNYIVGAWKYLDPEK